MTKIYGDMLKCNCDILYSNELTDLSIVEKSYHGLILYMRVEETLLI